MSKPEVQKARRERLKAEHRCVDCTAELPPERLTVRCVSCTEKNTRTTKRWQNRNAARYLDERRHFMASLYWSNREFFNERDRARKLAKKLAGICLDCPAPALEDNLRCGVCRERDLANRRVGARKAAQEEQAEIASYVPVDEVVDLARVRVLRAARHLGWFESGALLAELGYEDDRHRNTLTAAITRLAKSGGFERRRSQEIPGMGCSGCKYEYRITAAGVAELDAILGGRAIPRRQNQRRSA